MAQLYCRIRKTWVAHLPEEIVRQKILLHMIEEKGFPASFIAVEKSLRDLPHLALVNPQSIPNRRADIIVFGQGVLPLLLIECKAIKLTLKVTNQVLGYNVSVGARYVSIVNPEQIQTGWYDETVKGYRFISYLPHYEEFISEAVKK